MEKDKPLSNPPVQDVSTEEGKDVTSKETIKVEIEDKKDKELQEEVDTVIEKLNPIKEPEKVEVVEDKVDEKDKLESLSIEEINNLTKRNFESKEDFFKHYENLAAFSGGEEAQELRKKAKDYDTLAANNDVEKLLEKKEEKVETKLSKKPDVANMIDEKISPVDKEIKELRQQIERSDFLKKFPEAEPHLDTIVTVAGKQEKSLNDIYDGSDLQSLIKDSKDLQEVKEKDKDLGVESKNRLAPTKNQKVSEIIKDLVTAESGEGKQRDVDTLKQKLVEEHLGIRLEDQDL